MHVAIWGHMHVGRLVAAPWCDTCQARPGQDLYSSRCCKQHVSQGFTSILHWRGSDKAAAACGRICPELSTPSAAAPAQACSQACLHQRVSMHTTLLGARVQLTQGCDIDAMAICWLQSAHVLRPLPGSTQHAPIPASRLRIQQLCRHGAPGRRPPSAWLSQLPHMQLS
jgi:hypothetical protein